MRFSVVTISFNQAQYLERTIRSVLDQAYPDLEYIVVDPGSTDGSRDIIERYRSRISKVLLDPDRGAADGLNKGFAVATGGVLGYLNSDDVLLPGALHEAAAYLTANPGIDVVSGDCQVIDEQDRVLRLSHSDRYSVQRYAFGAGVLIQPSSFFRAAAYQRTSGFNIENRSNWDGELFVRMAQAGAQFGLSRRLWSGYRIHGQSITGTARMHEALLRYNERMFREIMQRERRPGDAVRGAAYRLLKYLENPAALTQRLLRGPVYGRMR
jgi:glycosyltransferase involved in cell wall biosynthesis